MVRNMTTLVEQIPTYLPCPTMFFNMDDPRKKSNLLHHPFSSFKNAKLTVHIVLTNSHDGHRWLATIRTPYIFLNIDQENSQDIQSQQINGNLCLPYRIEIFFLNQCCLGQFPRWTQVTCHRQNIFLCTKLFLKRETLFKWGIT